MYVYKSEEQREFCWVFVMYYRIRNIFKHIKVMWFLVGSLNSISNTVYNTVICIKMDLTLRCREEETESLSVIKSYDKYLKSI